MNLREETIKQQIAICVEDIHHYTFMLKEYPDNKTYKSLLEKREDHLIGLQTKLEELQRLEAE